MDEETFAFGSFRLIPAQRMLLEDGKPLRLGSRALDILVTLVERAGETIHKDQLIARTWPDTVVDEGALRAHVAALRKALGDGRAGNRYITNISGRGYSFVAPVTREQRQPTIAPADGTAVRGNLPALLTRIVGRDDIIAALAAQLAQRRLLTIVGPGGIGKTTVAIALAEKVSASYEDGVWFVGLASLPDPDLVASALGTVLGISLPGVNPVSGLAGWLRDKHALIVLDSCEHVIGAVAVIAEAILKAAARVSVLATSREPLRAEGEWLHRLPSLELPPRSDDLTSDAALRYSAVQLFDERARAITDGFALDGDDIAPVIEICHRLDGMPLALELAAARVDVFGVKALAARLDDRFAVLTSGRRTALPRHQTLRATMDWSYELLPETEQLVLRHLAVFQGDFTIDAAAAVATDDRINAADVFEAIANLAAKSLISTDISSDVTYHRLLDTTRAYALEKLSESGEIERVRALHAEYYRGLFERAETEWETRPTAQWLGDYGRQIDNLRAALDWAFSPGGDASIGAALTAAAVPLWMHLSLMEECRGRVERALAAIAAGAGRDQRREMQLHAALAASLMYTRDAVSEIDAAGTKALEIAESLDDIEYQLRSLCGLWTFRISCGQHRVAMTLAQLFYTLAAKRSDPKDHLISERMIGASQYYLGDLLSARRHLERVLAHDVAPAQKSRIVRFQVDPWATARAYLARILWLQGLPDQAMRTAETSVAEARATDHAISVCVALVVAACPIALWVGDLAAAEHYVEMLLDYSTRHALAHWHALGCSYQGVLVIQRGDLSAGLQLLRAAFDEPGAAGSVPRLFTFLLAEALGRAGQIADGLAVIEEAIVRSEHSEERWVFAELLRIKGELLLLQDAPGAAAAAEDHFRQALDWARRQGALSWELRTASSLARLWRDYHRVEEARVLGSVYGRFTEGFATADLRDAKSLLQELV
ncbi:MAG TPA: winged helix-turn-helix domain-containing protein [Stellaceae bacterium]|nr:winged helix-turn-helix domain-containing protein [Stellaceae bacterium]